MLSSRQIPLNDQGPSQFEYARTPGKALFKSRGALQENAIHRGAMTVNGKSKANVLRTPFHPSSRMYPHP